MAAGIYIVQNNRQEGPYTLTQVKTMLESGAIFPFTLAWKEGMTEWAPLNSIVALTHTIKADSTATRSVLSSTVAASIAPPVESWPRGIGGWLLFFCIMLTILSPLVSFGQMATNWQASESAFAQFPSLKTAVIFENFGSAALVIYGFVVGCVIWSGNKQGKRAAKQFLLIRLFGLIAVEAIAILLMQDLPSESLAIVLASVFGSAIREVIFFLIWWFYFKKSKRVRNTYDLVG